MTKKLAEFQTGLVQLRFAVAGRALQHGSNLVVFKAFDIVQDEHHSVPRWQRRYGAFKRDAVDGASKLRVAGAEIALRRILFGGIDGLLKRDQLQTFLAEVHQDEIHGKTMQPCGEGALAAETAQL